MPTSFFVATAILAVSGKPPEADQSRLALARGLEGRGRVGAEVGVDPARLQRQILHDLIVEIGHLGCLQPVRLVLLDPAKKDLLLVGAGRDGDVQARDITAFGQALDRAVTGDIEARQVGAIGGDRTFPFAPR